MEVQVGWVEHPTRDDRNFVHNQVISNAHHLSMFVYGADSLIYDYLAQREVTRAHLLLSRVGVNSNERVHLAIARVSNTGEPAGFAFVSPCLGEEMMGSVTMIVVDESRRRQGVFSCLMRVIKERFAYNVALTCKPELVPLYEKFGFKVDGVYQTHLSLSLEPERLVGQVLSVDDSIVMRNPKVVQALRNLRVRHGEMKVDSALREWKADFDEAESRALEYFSVHTTPPCFK